MRYLSAALVLTLSCVAPAAPCHAACALSKFLELPVTVNEARALASVKMNGTETGLMLDTGSFFSILNLDTVERLKLPQGNAPFGLQVTGVGGSTIPRLATVKNFTIGRTTVQNVEFLVLGNYLALSDEAGVLGQNLLRLGDAEFDLANGVVSLMHEKGCRSSDLPYWRGSGPYGVLDIQPTDRPTPEIITTVMINGVATRAMIDSGASISTLSRRGAARAGLSPSDPRATPGGVVMGVGRKRFDSWIVPVKSLKFDSEEVQNSRLRIVNTDQPPAQAEMILGADFLLSHRVYIAYAMNKLFFTYNGGPVFDLGVHRGTAPPVQPTQPPDLANASSAPAPASGPMAATDMPPDAAAFDRRGAASASRGELAAALADFSRAMELDAANPQYAYHRALARLQNHQPVLAMADLDQAVRLKADLAPALMRRAELRLAGRDVAGARADFAAAATAAPDDSTLPLREAGDCLQAREYAASEQLFSTWIDAHPRDERLTDALSGRCRTRAFQGTRLDEGLADCNKALRLASDTSPGLTDRALIRLRRREFDLAIADASAALKLQPRIAAALYIRGLALAGKGGKAAGEADIHAALAMAPKIGDLFRPLEITP